MNTEPKGVFGEIGLTLSGGGYRAAAFHLGALDYLDRIRALPHVRTLSTVSGGTFTGASYVLSCVRGVPFRDFFERFYRQLESVDLIEEGLTELDSEPSGVPSGRRDLIVAMAGVYARTFFSSNGTPDTFDEILNADITIREVIFNATEFRTGLAFRFQTSTDGSARIGNRNFLIPRDVAGRIRVADIVAASSCFPGGFEPFAFPHDFAWPNGKIPELLRMPPFGRPLPLMDGGVFDNQGIDSLLLAEERSSIDYDMIIISDVDRKEDDLFPFPVTESVGLIGRLRLRTIGWLLWLMMTLSAVTFVALLLNLITVERVTSLVLLTHLVPMLLAIGTAYGLRVLRNVAIDKVLPLMPGAPPQSARALGRIRVDQLSAMASLRLRSLIAMSSSIFMKRIRALGYRRIYWDERYNRKRVSNLVYHLATGEPLAAELASLVPEPSPALRAAADTASSMPTTLWFEAGTPDQLSSLVTCGRATMCYNLMKHVVRRYGDVPAAYSPAIAELWERLTSDWAEFQTRE